MNYPSVLIVALIILVSCQTSDNKSKRAESISQVEDKSSINEIEDQSKTSKDKIDILSLKGILDYYNFLRQWDKNAFYPEITEKSDTSEFFVVDKKNGYIEFILAERDKDVLQVCLFRDAEGNGILAVNRYSLINHWDTWYIPKGEKPKFYGVVDNEFKKLSFDFSNKISSEQFLLDKSKKSILPDSYFILPRFGTDVKYIIYAEVFEEMKKYVGNWPEIDGGYPLPPDWVEEIEAKIASQENLKQDMFNISFDKANREFVVKH